MSEDKHSPRFNPWLPLEEELADAMWEVCEQQVCNVCRKKKREEKNPHKWTGSNRLQRLEEVEGNKKKKKKVINGAPVETCVAV